MSLNVLCWSVHQFLENEYNDLSRGPMVEALSALVTFIFSIDMFGYDMVMELTDTVALNSGFVSSGEISRRHKPLEAEQATT